MTFEVAWLQTALDELADVWTRADSAQRKAITAAANLMEQRLRINPQAVGESREEGRRILFERPLAATFEIIAGQRLVRVIHVWAIRRGG